MASPGTLVVLHSLKKDIHLNNVLAIILTEPDAKAGRHAVQFMDGTTHNIKTTNMTPYIKHAAKGKNYTVKDIVKAPLKKLLPRCRGGALLSPKIAVLHACYRRILYDVGTAELLKGGYVEMVVASIDFHQDDSARLTKLLQWLEAAIFSRDDGEEGSPLRDQFMAAGLLPRLAHFLDTCKHTDRDVLFETLSALITFTHAASDKHREAAATLIPSIIAAMKRAGNCGVIQAEGDRPTSTQHPFR